MISFLLQVQAVGVNRRRLLIPHNHYHAKGVDMKAFYRVLLELQDMDIVKLFTYLGNLVVKVQYHTINKTALKYDGFPKIEDSLDKRKNALLERKFTRETHHSFNTLFINQLLGYTN